MRMLLLIVIGLALTGCGPTQQPDVAVQASPVATQGQVYLLSAANTAPVATPVPTAAGTPTTDYQARIGQAQLELQHSLATATMAAVTQQAIDTIQARIDISNQKTASATSAIALTNVAWAVATDDMRATQTVEAPLIERERIRTQWEPVLDFTLCGGIVLIIGVLVWAIIAIARAKYAALISDIPMPVPQQSESEKTQLVNVQLKAVDDYGWGSVDWSTLPIDREIAQTVARMILDGFHYTQAQMTVAANPLIKDGTFDSFGKWMVLNKIAIQMPDGRYVIQHREFFEQVSHD